MRQTLAKILEKKQICVIDGSMGKAGADVLLFETQPSLGEAKIEAAIAERLGADYWISFSCKDGLHINEGDLIRDCAAAFRSGYPRLRALGVNCTKPEYLESLIKELGKETDLPIVVYPNSGETYDPVTKTWNGKGDGHSFKDYPYISKDQLIKDFN